MDIYLFVRKFRKALLKTELSEYSFTLFEGFPANCCEFTSYLLAKYLVEELKIDNVLMVHGCNRYKKELRHVWLKVLNYDIDITANQFSSTSKTVFCDIGSEWHLRFNIYDSHTPNTMMTHFHEDERMKLESDYIKILNNIC
jgi:hypothetical protein